MDNRFESIAKKLRALNSKSPWQNMNWKSDGLLYLPAYLRRRTRDDVARKLINETIAISVVHEDVFGVKMSIERLLELMRSVSYTSWILLLSRISAVLASRGKHNMETQIQMAQLTFDQSTLERIDKINESGNKIIFTDWQVANLAKIALLICEQNPMSSNELSTNKESIGLCLLGINDHFGRSTPLDTSETETVNSVGEVYESFIRTFCLQYGENPMHIMARYYDLYFKLPVSEEGKAIQPFVDIQHEFQLITGISLENYLAVGFGFYAKYATAGLPGNQGKEGYTGLDPDDYLIDRRSYFEKTKMPSEDLTWILEDFSIEASSYKSLHQEKYGDSLGQLFDFIVFRNKPLVSINDNKLAPIVIDWLYEKLGEGCFWRVNDGIEDPVKQRDFRHFFGPLYQLYVQRLFKRLYPDSDANKRAFYDIPYQGKKGEMQSSDVILNYPNQIVLFEAKWPTLNMEATMIKGGIEAFDKDLEDIIIRSASQLDRNISDLIRQKLVLENVEIDKISAFYPVIIVSRPFPTGPILTPYILEKVSASGLLIHPLIKRLEIICTEELELIEPIIASGITFPQLLEEKWASELHFYNMKWYLEKRGKSLQNTYIRDLFHEFSDKNRKILFGK